MSNGTLGMRVWVSEGLAGPPGVRAVTLLAQQRGGLARDALHVPGRRCLAQGGGLPRDHLVAWRCRRLAGAPRHGGGGGGAAGGRLSVGRWTLDGRRGERQQGAPFRRRGGSHRRVQTLLTSLGGLWCAVQTRRQHAVLVLRSRDLRTIITKFI